MKRSKKTKKYKENNLIITISNLKFAITIDKFIYSKEEINKIKYIIQALSKNIWIDKTYVRYKGSRWKDAFIQEKSWYKLCNLIIDTDFGQKCSFYEDRFITESLIVVSITYLYSILCKYGYDVQYIILDVKDNSKFKVTYEMDNRKRWDS
jgi:hypothetical protein